MYVYVCACISLLLQAQCAAEANDVALAEMDEAIAKLQLWRINRAKETCEAALPLPSIMLATLT
jgi:hypothetical protein